MSIIDKTKSLRDEAWSAVTETQAYKAWRALDEAVKGMLGEEAAPNPFVRTAPLRMLKRPQPKFRGEKVTHGDVALSVLKRYGEPLPIGRWLEKSIEAGVNIQGADPTSNFRSTVSRDKRFYSFTRNNMYFWWITGLELPDNWKEATDPDLLDQSVASLSNQEGGDGHAATKT